MRYKIFTVISILVFLTHCKHKESDGNNLLPLLLAGAAPRQMSDNPYVVYRAGSATYLLEVDGESTPINLKSAFNAISPLPAGGDDEWVNLSRNKEWFVLSTERFGMAGWAGMAVIRGDFSAGSAVTPPSGTIHPTGFSTITSDGTAIIYPASDGTQTDLFVTRLAGGSWSDPISISDASPYRYNRMPALSPDETFVVFDCGPDPYSQDGTSLCRVDTDGSDLQVLYGPADFPGGTATNALHHPSVAPDYSIVFEGDWNGEQIYRYPCGGGTPVVINAEYGNDNSPTVLPDGRIVSLWLGREGGAGYHELKIMNGDGSSGSMLLINVDITDAGIGSGE